MTEHPDAPDSPDGAHPTPGRAGGVPAPLAVAASVAFVEAALLVLQGVAELFALSGQRLTMGLTTSLFFVLYGTGLAVCAGGIYRLRSVARAPVVVAQLIQLFVAWSFVGGSTTWVAVTLAVLALIVLAGIFHPDSLDALAEEDVPDQ